SSTQRLARRGKPSDRGRSKRRIEKEVRRSKNGQGQRKGRSCPVERQMTPHWLHHEKNSLSRRNPAPTKPPPRNLKPLASPRRRWNAPTPLSRTVQTWWKLTLLKPPQRLSQPLASARTR